MTEPPAIPGEGELAEIVNRMGGFVQNFAVVELMVVAWLLNVEASEAEAKAFLTKTRQFDARVRRLQSILRAENSAESLAVASHLDGVDPFRVFRNDVIHSPAGVDPDGNIALASWRGTVPLTLADLRAKITAVGRLSAELDAAYQARFKSIVGLQRTAEAAAPPTE